MNSITHICLDLDGTTLALKNDITPFCAQVLNEVNNQSKIILVSARIPSGMNYIQEKINAQNNPIICYNGAYILESNRVLFDTTLDAAIVDKVFEICQPLGVHLGIYSYNEWYVPEPSLRVQKEIDNTKTLPLFEKTKDTLSRLKKKKQGIHKLMLMGTKDTADVVEKALQLFPDQLTAYRSNDTLIEIAPTGINKLEAIKKVIGAPLETVMAFGDNYNDIEMVREVGLGVAVANAREALKEVAQRHTLSCAEDGVAHFLKEYFQLEP